MPNLASSLLSQNLLMESYQAHMVGICGAGMKALAEVLCDDGWTVSGSDRSDESRAWKLLSEMGINLNKEPKTEAITADVNLLVYSAAIPETNPEIVRAKELGIQCLSYVEAISRIVNSMSLLAVAGTHGKSSTTAWIVSLMQQSGLDPTFICGAERVQDNRNGKLGYEQVAIVEACEYRSHFLAFQPNVICLLGIEPDHFDCFEDFDEMINAYQSFLSLMPSNGTVVFNSDCSISLQLVQSLNSQKISFSILDSDSDWYAVRRESQIQLEHHGTRYLSIKNFLPGQHQLMNFAAAMASLEALGLDSKRIKSTEGIAFPELRRRFELIETGPFGTIIDDYAHHPTEIRMTLEAVREQFPKARIRCCFQPHQLSRTQRLHGDFVAALAIADEIFVLPIYGARETPSDLFNSESQKLVDDLQKQGHPAMFVSSLDRVWRTLETDACHQDILLTLGAGNITRIHNERTR